MPVYFIQDQATFFIKIGWTAGDPKSRLRDLQVGCPGELVILLVFPDDPDDEDPRSREKALHQCFERYRVRGEWFSPGIGLLQMLLDSSFWRGAGENSEFITDKNGNFDVYYRIEPISCSEIVKETPSYYP